MINNDNKTHIHLTDMTHEEREIILGNCQRSRDSYNRCMSEGLYNCSRDMCKEMRDAEDKHKHDTENNVTEYCSILQTQNQHLESKLEELKNKNSELESILVKHNLLLSQIVAKLNNIEI